MVDKANGEPSPVRFFGLLEEGQDVPKWDFYTAGKKE